MTIEQIKSTPSYEPLKRNGFTDANIITYYTLTSIGERKIFFAKVKCGALNDVKIETLAQRIELVIKSSFNGKRIVIFSGGAAKDYDSVMEEITGLAKGGSFGSIMGRNAFQRPKDEALKLLNDVMTIYKDHS